MLVDSKNREKNFLAHLAPSENTQGKEFPWNRLLLLMPCDIMNKIAALDVR